MTPEEERLAKIKLIETEGKRRAGEDAWNADMKYIGKFGGFSLEQIDKILQEPDAAVDRIRAVGREAMLQAMQSGDKDAEEAYTQRRQAEREAWRKMKGR